MSGKAQVDQKDYYGKTPLYWAAYKGQKLCMELLLSYGADVNSQCKHGGTPLHAAIGLFPECVLLLIQVRPESPTRTRCRTILCIFTFMTGVAVQFTVKACEITTVKAC